MNTVQFTARTVLLAAPRYQSTAVRLHSQGLSAEHNDQGDAIAYRSYCYGRDQEVGTCRR